MIVILASFSLFSALFRGVDYLVFPQRESVLVAVENAATTREWGVILVFGVLMAVAGYVVKRWPVAILGHALLIGVFAAFGIGALAVGFSDLAGDGLRTGISYLCLQTVLHSQLAIIAWRRWDMDRD